MSTVNLRIPIDKVPQDVIDAIHDIGIPQHVKGYQYLIYGVNIMLDNLTSDISFTKHLYPEVADAFNTTGSRVERAIRHAIDVLFTHGDYDKIKEYFGNTVSNVDCKPMNSQFLYGMAHKIHRDRLKHS